MRENVNNTDWYVFNDRDVRKQSQKNYLKEIKVRTPYILFYMKEN